VTVHEDQTIALPPERILRLLAEGEIEVEGLIPWSSNATILVTVRDAEHSALAVYKPKRGERPLWDFPHGTLGMREVASYLISETLGWGLVPPTVLRDGPHGIGSVQFYVHCDESAHFFSIQNDGRYIQEVKRLVALDVVINNADRKAGHCLLGHDGRLWAIDNALTFHEEPKLRTVIWDYAGEPLPYDVQADLRRLQEALAEGAPLSQALERMLSRAEMRALRQRVYELLQDGCFPEPGVGRVVPWPLV
jgi:hypothetical protein